MKIMITGGLGFVGSHLSEELLCNHKLYLVSKSFSKKQNISHLLNKINVAKIDITNFSKIGKYIESVKPDIIIHLAGQTSHTKSFEKPLYDLDINTRSTLFILEKIRQIDLKCRFILGSTFIVIGQSHELPVTEHTSCNPTTVYGINRLASEYYSKVYNQVYGLDTIIFRITNSFGPREQVIATKNAINFLIYQAFKGNKITIFNKGNFYRDLIYVSDVVDGIKTIMEKGKSGNLYWISSGKKTWFYQFGEWLEKLTGTKVSYVKPSPYTKKTDVGNFVAENSKLQKLGWKPKVTVKDGIKKTLEYFAQSKVN